LNSSKAIALVLLSSLVGFVRARAATLLANRTPDPTGFDPNLTEATLGSTVPVAQLRRGHGVTVKFTGAPVLSNVAWPGFSPPDGSRFRIGARTAGAVERAIEDDVAIVPR
jgi:hypothetical protein